MVYFHVYLSPHLYGCTLFFQNIEPNSFIENPIIFGDFMKIGAEKSDRLYEELTDMTKLKNILQDVSSVVMSFLLFVLLSIMIKLC